MNQSFRAFVTLGNLLKDVSGASFITIDTETDVKLKGGKSHPLQGLVKKSCVGSNVMVFQNKRINGYQAMVERRLKAEGKNPANFVLGPRTWGERIPETPFIEHKDNYYLEVIFLRPGKVEILVHGVVTAPETISGFPEEKEEGHQGGLNDKVFIRTYDVKNIRAVTINGVKNIL